LAIWFFKSTRNSELEVTEQKPRESFIEMAVKFKTEEAIGRTQKPENPFEALRP